MPNNQSFSIYGALRGLLEKIGVACDPRDRLNEIFKDHIALNATLNGGLITSRCHPGTRDAILNKLVNWVGDHNGKESVTWLSGRPGQGKTSIAHTVAEMLSERGLLAAGFFFRGGDARGHDERFFVSTLAFQISHSVPELAPYIATVAEKDPLILQRSLEVQFHQLIVGPVIAISSKVRLGTCTLDRTPRLIVIDALNECRSLEAQGSILEAISNAIPHLNGYFKFLVVSRPEVNIHCHFFALFEQCLYCSLEVDLVSDYDYFRPYVSNINSHNITNTSIKGSYNRTRVTVNCSPTLYITPCLGTSMSQFLAKVRGDSSASKAKTSERKSSDCHLSSEAPSFTLGSSLPSELQDAIESALDFRVSNLLPQSILQTRLVPSVQAPTTKAKPSSYSRHSYRRKPTHIVVSPVLRPRRRRRTEGYRVPPRTCAQMRRLRSSWRNVGALEDDE